MQPALVNRAKCTNCLAPNPDLNVTSLSCVKTFPQTQTFPLTCIQPTPKWYTLNYVLNPLKKANVLWRDPKYQSVCCTTPNLASGAEGLVLCIATAVADLINHTSVLSQSFCPACGPQWTMNCLSVLQQINFLFPEQVCFRIKPFPCEFASLHAHACCETVHPLSDCTAQQVGSFYL